MKEIQGFFQVKLQEVFQAFVCAGSFIESDL